MKKLIEIIPEMIVLAIVLGIPAGMFGAWLYNNTKRND